MQQFTSAATADTNYTVIGKVKRKLQAKATNTVSNKVINFNYAWNGKQSAAGSDATNPSDLSRISFTLKYKQAPTVVTDVKRPWRAIYSSEMKQSTIRYM